MIIFSHMRKHTVLALLAWIVGWTVLVLQPCCEVLASANPHKHKQVTSSSGYDHAAQDSRHAEHLLQKSNLTHEHVQCLDELPTGQELDSLATLKSDRLNLKIKFTNLLLTADFDLTAVLESVRINNYNSPEEIPPPQNLYHRTQRLRI